MDPTDARELLATMAMYPVWALLSLCCGSPVLGLIGEAFFQTVIYCVKYISGYHDQPGDTASDDEEDE